MVALMVAARPTPGATPPSGGALVLPPIVVTATMPSASKAEPHPEIQAAIRSLEHAREHLDHAAHDFGGHRVEAIGAIDAALRQLHICMEYDRR